MPSVVLVASGSWVVMPVSSSLGVSFGRRSSSASFTSLQARSICWSVGHSLISSIPFQLPV